MTQYRRGRDRQTDSLIRGIRNEIRPAGRTRHTSARERVEYVEGFKAGLRDGILGNKRATRSTRGTAPVRRGRSVASRRYSRY